MKKIKNYLIGILILFMGSCRNDFKEFPGLSEKEIIGLEDIKNLCQADDITLKKVTDFDSTIDKSLSINILNCKWVTLADTNLNTYCRKTFIQFAKSLPSKDKYDLIEVNFQSGYDYKIFHMWHSRGMRFEKETIAEIFDQVNSIDYLLDEKYKAYEKAGENDSIIIYTNNLIIENPNYALAYKYQGAAFLHLHDTTSAFKAFQKAWLLNKNDVQNALNFAIIFIEQKQFEQGLKYLDSTLLLDKEYPAAIYYRGICHYYLGDSAKGCEDVLRAKEMGMLDANAFMTFNCK